MATAVTVVTVAMEGTAGTADMSAMVDMVEAGAASQLALPSELSLGRLQRLTTPGLDTTAAAMA